MRALAEPFAEERHEVPRRSSATMRRSALHRPAEPTLLLLVSDDAAAAFERTLGDLPLKLVHVSTSDAAIGEIRDRSRAFSAAVVDVEPSDGSWLDAIRELRHVAPDAMVLALAEAADPDTVNAAHLEGVALAVKPFPDENLLVFARRVLAVGDRWKREAVARVDALAREVGLSPREREALSLLVTGVPRCCLASEMGIAETTLKSQSKSYCGRAGATTSSASWPSPS